MLNQLKSFISFLFLFFAVQFSKAQQDSGIHFIDNLPLKDVLAMSREQNKPVFVDIYTTWCGPCKRMAEHVFSKKQTGDKFNSAFINYKIDAEKGEGITLAKTYNVKGFPTYLFLNGNGEVVFRTLGYTPQDLFMKQAKIGLSEFSDPRPYYVWEKEYPARKNDPIFLRDFIMKRIRVGQESTAIINTYFKLIPKEQWLQKENISMIKQNRNVEINSPIFNHLAKNTEVADEVMKGDGMPGSIHDLLYTVQMNALNKAIKEKNDSYFESVFLQANKTMPSAVTLKPEFSKPSETYWRLYYFKRTNRYKNFISMAPDFYDRKYMNISKDSALKKNDEVYNKAMSVYNDPAFAHYNTNKAFMEMLSKAYKSYFINSYAGDLAEAAGIILKYSTNTALDKRAKEWIKRAIEVKDSPGFLLTQALLLYKTGDTREAVHIAGLYSQNTIDEKKKQQAEAVIANMESNKPFKNILELL